MHALDALAEVRGGRDAPGINREQLVMREVTSGYSDHHRNGSRSRKVNGLGHWITQHQVMAYYLLVFGISWPCMIGVFAVSRDNMVLQALCGLVATVSPALAALTISTISHNGEKGDGGPYRRLIFLGGWILSWAVLVLHTGQVRGAPLSLSVVVPTAFVAMLPAWLLSCACSRNQAVRNLFGTLLRPRGNVLWYLAAFLIVPAIQLLGAGITTLTGGSVDWGADGLSMGRTPVLVGLTFMYGFLISGGINEETGWRGFVLPRLQARYPVIVAIAIVWFFWALWHVPYDVGQGVPIESMLFNRLLLNSIWAVLFAWVYNRTKGSLLAPAIFHPAMNSFGDILPRTDAATVLFIILALAVVVYDRMWRKLPADSQAVH